MDAMDVAEQAELIRRTATPAVFAHTATEGRFQKARHILHIDRYLTRVAKGGIRRLMVSLPPQHGKSELTAKWFTSWSLGTFPQMRLMFSSAVHDLAARFSGESRDILKEHGWMFGVQVKDDAKARDRWSLESGGEARAFGVGGSLFGSGADLGIIDDYHGSIESALSESDRERNWRWYQGTWRNRLSVDAAEVIIATRYHPDDLIGRLLKSEPEDWTVLKLPALATENDPLGRNPGEPLWPPVGKGRHRKGYDRKWLERMRDNLYSAGFGWQWECLYQQDPPGQIDSEFAPAYFGDHLLFDDFPWDQMRFFVLTLDPSVGKSEKSDYSAFVWLGLDAQGTMWVDADIRRRDIHAILHDGMGHCRRINPAVFGVEGQQFQAVLAPLYDRLGREQGWGVPLKLIHQRLEKKQRIRSMLTPYLARGNFRFRRSPGCALLLQQLKQFPGAKHDDGPDALADAVSLARFIYFGGAPEEEHEPMRVVA